MKIEIVKVNETYVKVYSDINIENEIRDYFTFKSPGYQFSPKYKARVWDGNISLYNIKTKQLPIGLYPRLLEFCKESNIEVKFRECERFSEAMPHNDVDIAEIQAFVNDLNLYARNEPITARDYQVSAIHKAVSQKRVTLISPTSSGKSNIIYCIIRWILEDDPEARILLLVPNVQLVNQMFGDFQDYSSHNDWDVNKHCQKLYSGQSKELSKRVLITTWQSFTKIANDKVQGPKILSLYRAVISDEAHGSKSKEMQSILEKCTQAAYRIGTTGTLDTSPTAKVHQLQIEGFLGPIHKVITTKELIDSNQVAGLKIKSLVLKYNEDDCKLIKSADYQQEVKWLIENNSRNAFLMKVALIGEGTTLLLVKHRDTHAKKLYEALKKVSPKPVYYVSGSVDAEERERIRKVANVESCIIVATYATMSTGVSIPNIRNVIFGCPSKSSILVLQSIGRGLRLHKDKDAMTLYDIVDDLRYKKSENYSYQHALERFTIYRREKFDISVKEIPLA